MSSDTKNINRNNYEIWMIDYLDGNLVEEKVKQLLYFMDNNPDLKEEFEMMRSIKLNPEKIKFDRKHKLFKSTDPMFDMPESDFLMIKEMEEGLQAEELKRLTELKELYPALNEDAAIYKSAKLQPEKIVYSRKSTLKKKNNIPRILISVGSIAAAAILLFLIIPVKDIIQTENPVILSSVKETDVDDIENTVEPIIKVQPEEIIHKKTETIESTSETKNNTSYIAQTVKEDDLLKASNERIIERQEAIALISKPQIKPLPEAEKINTYEIGLTAMIPHYIDNIRLMETYNYTADSEEEIIASYSLLKIGIKFLGRLVPVNKFAADEAEYSIAEATPIWEFTRRQ